MKEYHLEVRRTARYMTLGPSLPAAREVWFVLHGYRQLARRFLRRFQDLDDGTRLLVAPEALNRFYVGRQEGRHGPGSLVGATWMTREDRENEIRDYVGYLDRLGTRVLGSPAAGSHPGEASTGRGRDGRTGTAPPAVTVLGFSQGLQTAVRWAVLGRVRPDRLVLWGDYIPPDLDMEQAARALEGVEVVVVVGSRDASRRDDLERDQALRLERWGIGHRILSHPGGHELDPSLLAELAGTPPRRASRG